MRNLSQALFLDSEVGALTELPKAGTTLEVPLVYDRVADDLCQMARAGVLEVVARDVQTVRGEKLITHLAFRRLR
ncbi:hypothetical protein [Roseateles flavus]|uniref:Uncharacterized protein n=1 Tax=Roseateles flavus TaxID=3149041 RepID=A0ABV0GF20_9BURK